MSALFSAPAAMALDLNPLSIVKGAVEHAVEDRTSEDAAKDVEIKASIAADVIDKMGSEVISISSDVYEQRVMLTGIVETPEVKSKAGELARGVEGVKTVYNELRVIPKVEREKGSVEGFVDDTVIETKIDAQLLDASGVSSRNFRWRSVHGHVYLMGRALSAAELEKAKGVIKGIDGTQSLTVHVEVRPKE
ncbi:MAG: BON domain-containing protein [Rhodospirillales bacterium]|nr:BON domain-containing protein [Rhodospirillales bacterium]MBO6788274.1 BON domain-containing protein [Rhodospirillales bacterium]